MNLGPEVVFQDVPRASLDAEAAVCYLLDEKLCFLYCNPAWDRFAAENGAPDLAGCSFIGRCVLDCVDGELREFYRKFYEAALADRQERSLDLHCASAETDRLLKMHVYPLKSAPALLVRCSVRVERQHTYDAEPAVEARYRDGHGLIVMCSNCRRTRRPNANPETWDWVPGFVTHQPENVSHGLCGICVEYYYPLVRGHR